MCACGSLLDGGIVFLNKGRLVFGGFNSFYVSLSLLFSKALKAQSAKYCQIRCAQNQSK